jgi:hypothetical protein
MGLYATFKTDAAKETRGIQIPYEPNDDGSIPTFTIARAGGANVQWALEMERIARPYQRQIQLETLKKSVSDKLVMTCFVRTVLLNWENVFNQKNEPIAYNEENAMQLMTELPDLYNDLFTQSNKLALFREDSLEATVKN